MATVPVAEPSATGVNVTLMLHDAPGTSAAAQVLVWLNGPVAVTPVICNGPVPLLFTVMLRAVLVVPNTCEENGRLLGVTVAAGVVPVPMRGTLWDAPMFPELSVTVSVPVIVPGAAGVKV